MGDADVDTLQRAVATLKSELAAARARLAKAEASCPIYGPAVDADLLYGPAVKDPRLLYDQADERLYGAAVHALRGDANGRAAAPVSTPGALDACDAVLARAALATKRAAVAEQGERVRCVTEARAALQELLALATAPK